MTKYGALEIIFSSTQYRELMEALEEAKNTLSPDEWREVSHTMMIVVDTFVTQRLAELSEGESGKPFRA